MEIMIYICVVIFLYTLILVNRHSGSIFRGTNQMNRDERTYYKNNGTRRAYTFQIC